MKGKAKNKLQFQKQISDVVCLLVLELKEEYKNLNIDDLKQSHDLILQVMEKIDKRIEDKTLSKKTVNKVDKNDLVVQIFKGLFPDLSGNDIVFIEETIEFIINNKLIKSNFFFKCLKLLVKLL